MEKGEISAEEDLLQALSAVPLPRKGTGAAAKLAPCAGKPDSCHGKIFTDICSYTSMHKLLPLYISVLHSLLPWSLCRCRDTASRRSLRSTAARRGALVGRSVRHRVRGCRHNPWSNRLDSPLKHFHAKPVNPWLASSRRRQGCAGCPVSAGAGGAALGRLPGHGRAAAAGQLELAGRDAAGRLRDARAGRHRRHAVPPALLVLGEDSSSWCSSLQAQS